MVHTLCIYIISRLLWRQIFRENLSIYFS